MGWFWKWTKRILKTIIFLIVFIYGILWIPAVQQFIGQQFTAILSEKWNTVVRIDRVHIRPFNNVMLKGVYIEDLHQQPMISADMIEARNYNIWALFNKEIDIGHAVIHNGFFDLHRREGDPFLNLDFIIRFFSRTGPRKDPPPEKFRFNIRFLEFEGFHFRYGDATAGTVLDIESRRGYFDNRDVDLIGKKVIADSILFDSVIFTVNIDQKIPVQFTAADSARLYPPFDSTIPYWNLGSDRFRIENAAFIMRNRREEVHPERTLDFADLFVNNFRMDVHNFALQKEVFSGWVNQLRGTERKGFELEDFHGNVEIGPKKVGITNFRLQTPNSTIGDSLVFKYKRYRHFYEFVDKVKLSGQLNSTTIRFRDIAAFAYPLHKIELFEANLDEPIQINGDFKGTINNFKAKNLDISLGNHTALEGSLSMNNITFPDEAFMMVDCDRFTSHYSDMVKIIPFVKFPKQIARMGTLRFEGNFTGFLRDFVAYGKLETQLGKIDSDLKMNLRGGKELAKYSGRLAFTDFNIGRFLNHKDLGSMSLSSKVTGTGLTIDSLDAKLKDAAIQYFDFKDYHYENIALDGHFKKKTFKGQVKSLDSNFHFAVKGSVDLNTDIPKVDIAGVIDSIDFHKLKIIDKPLGIHLDTFDIQAQGNNIDNFQGHLTVRGSRGHYNNEYYNLKKVYLDARDQIGTDTSYFAGIPIVKPDTTRKIKLRSDILDVDLFGKFDMVNLPKSMQRFVKRNYPNLFRNLDYSTEEGYIPAPQDTTIKITSIASSLLKSVIAKDTIPQQTFDVIIRLDDSQNFTKILSPEFKSLKGIYLTGRYNGRDEEFDIEGDVENIHVGTVRIVDEQIIGHAVRKRFWLENGIGGIHIGDSLRLPSIDLKVNALSDLVTFSTKVDKIGKVASKIALNGQIAANAKEMEIRLNSSNLSILNQPWTINDDNYIRIGKQKLDVHNVRLTNDIQLIELSSIKNKGLALCIEHMDLGWLYDLVQVPKIDIDGSFSADLRVENIFKQHGLEANVYFDSLIINEDAWGKSYLNVVGDSLKAPLNLAFVHSSPLVDTLWLKGSFTPFFATEDKSMQNYLNVHFEVGDAQARILEYFMETQISNTVGTADVVGNLNGPINKLNIGGTGKLKEVATSINFLKTRFALAQEGRVTLANDGFHIIPKPEYDDDGVYVKGGIPIIEVSRPNDTAYVAGSIVHNRFKNFGLDLYMYLRKNLVMNTTKDDNSTFYGKVFASGEGHFFGPFEQLKLTVDGKTEAGTILELPLGDPTEVAEVNYITFVDKKAQLEDTTSIKDQVAAGGLDLELNIEVTPEAEARLIFDEKAGDVIKGRGSGFLNITYTPSGEFGMSGDFKIAEGNYLFTFQNLVNKNFIVKPGGTISWSGDPYEAQLDIQAAYQQKVGLYNLISAYIPPGDADLKKLASRPTKIDLLMNMRGSLLSPDISFDIGIDDVDPTLRTSTDLALRTVREDKNELNRQVFGVIGLQQFLPLENNQNQSLDLVSSSISTLSELISQQFSLYINDLISQVIDDVDFISSLEVDVNFNVRDNEYDDVGDSRNSELGLGVDQTFLDNRLRLYIGANFDIGSNDNLGGIDGGSSQNYIGGDFIVEYLLTPNGQLKIRAYNRTESTILGRTNRSGIGLSYKKEFDNFGDLFKEIGENFKKQKEKRQVRKQKRLDARAEKAKLKEKNIG
ncbi:MAG: translocation/assembly module TamB [Aureispira sp.]|nr:translocation/assembly module TamB [Aureispira sp.]